MALAGLAFALAVFCMPGQGIGEGIGRHALAKPGICPCSLLHAQLRHMVAMLKVLPFALAALCMLG